jgi:poly-gamma-glutamate capsule biosynthesis protein CapA/YwtB (metallophosphatase superfamily)
LIHCRITLEKNNHLYPQMAKKSKLQLKIILLAICLAAAGYLALRPNTFDLSKKTTQPLPEEKSTELIFVGDIMLDRGVELKIKNASTSDFTFPFQKIAQELKPADIVFGNLESVISDKGEKVGSIYSFRADPKAIEGLTYAKFNILSVANNHALDYTRKALEDTFLRLKTAGIDYVGGGKNATEAGAPVIKEVNGTKFAFLAYTNLCPLSWKATAENAGINCLADDDLENYEKEITQAKKIADIVIVSLHAGNEYSQTLNNFQTDFVKGAIDAGADLVVGHHPHVVQKYEQYKDKWIFYSLGNFVFDQSFSKETMQGLMVKVTVKDKKIQEVVPIKTQLNNSFQVELASSTTADIPIISLSASNLAQGQTLLIKINNLEDLSEISGQFNAKEIKFFKANGKIFGLIGIDAKMKTGNYNLTINFPDNYKIEKQIKVASGNFPTTELAFTPELEEQGYNATSVSQMISQNDTPKLSAALATSSAYAYFSQSFVYPLDKIVDVGAFGNIRKSASTSLQHLGTDLEAKLDSNVYATNAGLVKATLNLMDYGNTIVIDHGLGIFSLYLHLDKFKVKTGQKVTRGQIIGLSGNTGYSIAPHLHFSIKLNGLSVNPLKFIQTAQF